MNKKYFITTTLPYANSTPHVGHCLEFIQADALARFLRKDNDVRLNIGLDEHGLKIYQAAIQANVTPKEFVQNIGKKWHEFCAKFNIRYDVFYNTSHPTHYKLVKKYWQDLLEKGDIYKKHYVGKYCVGCEEFKPETQLVDGKCELHPTLQLQETSEENWFLKITNYKEEILQFVENSKDFLKPASKRNELINLIKNSEDLSVSRRRDLLPWGVEVPNDSSQTIYVWFEALLNYFFAAEIWNDNTLIKVQLCGPDNLKFQALIWQAILRANKNDFSDHILVHGTILDEKGQKMSKSVGNVIDPISQLEKYSIDAVRYYILKSLHTYNNSNWSEQDLVDTYNSDLANNFGNLISRALHLIEIKNVEITTATDSFKDEVFTQVEDIIKTWKSFEISNALQKTLQLVAFGNKYINDNKPWSNPDICNEVLNNLYYLLQILNDLYEPVMPNAHFRISQALKEKKKAIIFNKLELA